jgi:hypothetical protein
VRKMTSHSLMPLPVKAIDDAGEYT